MASMWLAFFKRAFAFKISAGSLGTNASKATLTPSRGHRNPGAAKINPPASPSP